MLDLHTFGKSQAAVDLSNYLIKFNDPKIISKITGYIHRQNFRIKQIKNINDISTRQFVSRLYFKYLTNAQKIRTETPLLNIEPIVTEWMFNVIKTHLRRMLNNEED